MESVCRFTPTVGSNPTLSAIFHVFFLSVRLAVLHLYLICTRPVISPHAAQIGFELLLPFLNPGRVVPLGHLHRRMAEQKRKHARRHARLEELDTEGVAESV